MKPSCYWSHQYELWYVICRYINRSSSTQSFLPCYSIIAMLHCSY